MWMVFCWRQNKFFCTKKTIQKNTHHKIKKKNHAFTKDRNCDWGKACSFTYFMVGFLLKDTSFRASKLLFHLIVTQSEGGNAKRWFIITCHFVKAIDWRLFGFYQVFKRKKFCLMWKISDDKKHRTRLRLIFRLMARKLTVGRNS